MVQRERQLLHIILQHICELNARKLYLERAYSSLYEYLTKELGYSGSAAMRRIEAAKLLREVPVVAAKIQEGTLNLSQIGELSRSIKEKENSTGVKITPPQKEVLLQKIVGKTTLETQKELAVALDIPVKDFEKQRAQKDESVRLELTLSKEQYQKLLTCRDLAAHLLEQRQGDYSWASVFEVLADQYLAKNRPSAGAKKNAAPIKEKAPEGNIDARAEVRTNESSVLTSKSNPTTTTSSTSTPASVSVSNSHFNSKSIQSTNSSSSSNSNFSSRVLSTPISLPNHNLNPKLRTTTASDTPRINKTLTVKTRKIILQRDECCQYKDPKTGKQCRSTFGLQVDHRRSQWAGGSHELGNLQVLCGRHNRFKYQQEINLKCHAER